jgi:hypothetical protein
MPPIDVGADSRTLTLPEGSRVKWVSPTAVFRINENSVDQAGEGGRISIVADNVEDDKLTEDMKMLGATVLLNYRKDEPMRQFPLPAQAGRKRWSVILVEHDLPA